MMTDTIGDFLTRIRNGGTSRKSRVDAVPTKMNRAIAKILAEEGFIKAAKEVNSEGENVLRIYLKFEDGDPLKPMIQGIQRASKPGLRRYVAADAMPRVMSGFGLAVISTSKGVVSDKEARKLGVGGEHICSVW